MKAVYLDRTPKGFVWVEFEFKDHQTRTVDFPMPNAIEERDQVLINGKWTYFRWVEEDKTDE